MNNKLFPVACMLVCAFLCGCQSLQQTLGLEKPSAQLTNVKFADADSSSASLVFDVEVYNPYPVDLPLTNLVYNLTTGNTSLLSGTTQLQTNIAAKNKTTVSLPVKINYLDLFKATKDIRPGSTINYKADATLTTNPSLIGKFDIPLKKEGQMAVPEVTGSSVINLLDKITTK